MVHSNSWLGLLSGISLHVLFDRQTTEGVTFGSASEQQARVQLDESDGLFIRRALPVQGKRASTHAQAATPPDAGTCAPTATGAFLLFLFLDCELSDPKDPKRARSEFT